MAGNADLLGFVREHVRSVWALELLLLLKRDAARGWTREELVRELRGSQALVSDNLARLQVSGLVIPAEADGYCYAPASPVLAELCDRLQCAYRERPVAVINMIARPVDPLQSLADAFKFRGEER